jgi:hypothetical protein
VSPFQVTTTQLSQSQPATTQPSQTPTTHERATAASSSSIPTAPGGADTAREWLLSSIPEGRDEFFPDWHIILAGGVEAGTISIPEDKTATGTYEADGDRLTIHVTRVLGDWTQKFHYDFTGYPGDDISGTLLIGRLNPSEPEWRSPVPARATR